MFFFFITFCRLRGASDGLSETSRDCRCSLLILTLHIIRIQSSVKHQIPAAFSFLIKFTF